MQIEEAYREKKAAQLKEWSAQIDLLDAQVENSGADLRLKRAVELEELRVRQRTASAKLQDLEKASGEAWEQVKITADKIWEDLKIGMAEAHAKFK